MKETLKKQLRARFEAYLAEHGMRRTPVRFRILEKCFEQRSHFNINNLYHALSSDCHVSLASVYNTIELLCDCNILRKHFLHENEASYELAGLNHLHLICLECGAISVRDLDSSGSETSTLVDDFISAGRYRSFSPTFMTANVYGRCALCKAANFN